MRFFFLLLLLATLEACSVKQSDTPAEGSPNIPQDCDGTNSANCAPKPTEPVGPYVMNFTTAKTFEQSFEVNLAQSEGSVQYFTTTPEITTLHIDSVQSILGGCDASKVDLGLYWIPDASTQSGYPVGVNSSFKTLKNIKGLLLLALKKMDGCSRLSFKLKVSKIEDVPGAPFPANLIGNWAVDLSSIGVPVKFQMNISAAQTPKLTYYSSCGAGAEELVADIESWSTTLKPPRFSARITTVTKPFYGGCSNVLALKASDLGKYLTCLAEREGTYGSFKLGCQITGNKQDFPLSYESATIYWKQ